MKDFFTPYNKMVRSVLEQVQGDIYIVHLIKENKCTCLKPGSQEPDYACKKCLGTGYRIKIKKAKAVIQDSNLATTVRSTTETVIAKDCYLLAEYQIALQDIIVSNQYILIVNEVKESRSQNNETVYKRCFGVNKKYYTEIFRENFNAIIKKSGEKR